MKVYQFYFKIVFANLTVVKYLYICIRKVIILC